VTSTKATEVERRNPGRAPEMLKIEGDWKDAMQKPIFKSARSATGLNPK
jgi:hypothetical protein